MPSLTPQYAPEQLGRVVRTRRLAQTPPLTQEDLANRAGYGTGGNVSISRIEQGTTRPSPERLTGIAEALCTTVRSLELEAASVDLDSDADDVSAPNRGASNKAFPVAETTKELGRRLQHLVDVRVSEVNAQGAQLDQAHALARESFFQPFVEAAGHIADTPIPPAADLPADDDDDPSAADQAAIRIKISSNRAGAILAGLAGGGAAGAAAGGAAAYATFVGAATFGTASTGAAISTLSGVAATNAALAALGGGSLAAGGAGMAGGTALLSGLVAAPIAILGVGGLVWMMRRNKRQERELRVKLDELARELEAGRPGFEATVDAMARSAAVLHDIGTHAGRAVTKWIAEVGDANEWSQLTAHAQERYEAFNTIIGCQIEIVTMDFTNFMTLRGDSLKQHVQLTNSILDTARSNVDSLV